jgi:Leucine-rich repeat (LRR) protein
MTALTTLFLHENQLAGLPDAIGQLTGLKSLDLEDCGCLLSRSRSLR